MILVLFWMWKSLLAYLQWFILELLWRLVSMSGFFSPCRGKSKFRGCHLVSSLRGGRFGVCFSQGKTMENRVIGDRQQYSRGYFPVCPIWWKCIIKKSHMEPWQLCTLKVGSSYYEMRKTRGHIEANFREGLSTPRSKRIQDRWDI